MTYRIRRNIIRVAFINIMPPFVKNNKVSNLIRRLNKVLLRIGKHTPLISLILASVPLIQYLSESDLRRFQQTNDAWDAVYSENSRIRCDGNGKGTSHIRALEFLAARSVPMNSMEMSCAELGEVDLENAHMSGARIVSSNLTKANLSNSDIQHSNFYNSSLAGAKLMNTKLGETNFVCADLSYSDFTGASLIDDEGRKAKFKDACFADKNRFDEYVKKSNLIQKTCEEKDNLCKEASKKENDAFLRKASQNFHQIPIGLDLEIIVNDIKDCSIKSNPKKCPPDQNDREKENSAENSFWPFSTLSLP